MVCEGIRTTIRRLYGARRTRPSPFSTRCELHAQRSQRPRAARAADVDGGLIGGASLTAADITVHRLSGQSVMPMSVSSAASGILSDNIHSDPPFYVESIAFVLYITKCGI
jgi:hypothetical protein